MRDMRDMAPAPCHIDGNSGHYQDLDISNLEGHDSVCNCIIRGLVLGLNTPSYAPATISCHIAGFLGLLPGYIQFKLMKARFCL